MTQDWVSLQGMISAGLGLAFGVAVARAHLAALALNVRLYLAPGAPWRPIVLHVARQLLVAASFTAAALLGAGALAATLAGFTLGRALALGRRR